MPCQLKKIGDHAALSASCTRNQTIAFERAADRGSVSQSLQKLMAIKM
jgi:hypothetical protein